MDLSVWGTMHVGRVRANNQDTFCALELTSPPSHEGVRLSWDSQTHDQEVYRPLPLGPRGSLLLVADGIGRGTAGGEVASRLAVTSILEAIDRIWNPDGQIIGTGAATAATFAERLRDSFVEAHARIQAYAAERPWLHGMGTTVTAAGVLDRVVVFSHVGDSRAYLLRDQQLVQITRDQTWVQDMVDAGTMTPVQARTSPRRSLLLQALGTTPGLSIPIWRSDLKPGDVLLLCSDGLSGAVDEDTLARVLLEAPTLRAACDKLVEDAIEAGGRDNIILIVAEPKAR